MNEWKSSTTYIPEAVREYLTNIVQILCRKTLGTPRIQAHEHAPMTTEVLHLTLMNLPDSTPFLRALRIWCGVKFRVGCVVVMCFLIAWMLDPLRSFNSLMASKTIYRKRMPAYGWRSNVCGNETANRVQRKSPARLTSIRGSYPWCRHKERASYEYTGEKRETRRLEALRITKKHKPSATGTCRGARFLPRYTSA